MKGQTLLTQYVFTRLSCGRSTLGSALSQGSTRVLSAGPSRRHSLVPSPVSSAAPSCAPSCAPSHVPSHAPSRALSHALSHALSVALLSERSPSAQPTLQDPSYAGLPQLEVSSNTAGAQEEEEEEEGESESDGKERGTEFLLNTEEDGPMAMAKDKIQGWQEL